MIGYDYNFRTPYSLQWNVTFEKEISGFISGSIGYVADRGFSMLQILPGNLPLPLPTASLNNIDARRPLSNFSNVGIIYPRARTWYDSLQLTGDVRSMRGLTLRLTCSYGNWNGETGPDGNRHQFRAFYVYDLPRLLNAKPLVRSTLGGWQIAGSISITDGSRDEKMARYFDTSSFDLPASRTVFGTLPRNALLGPATWGSNLPQLKKIQINERMCLPLRGYGYNFLNHTNLNNPNSSMNSSNFGRILNRSGSRAIQIGGRLVF